MSACQQAAADLALRPKYRSEIDGLRAIAVLPVIIYHAGLAICPGGFVGVDVFFVISGYLITSILALEMDAGRYSVLGFYERRIRRLFPALVGLLIVCTVISTLLMMPQDLKEYGQSAFATALSASNIYFWLKVGYFESSAVSRPLLHTWSLGVEDQFYVVFPIVLMGAARLFKNCWRRVIDLLLVASLVFSAFEVRSHPESAFYLLPSRMWELLLGSWLATRPWAPGPRWRREALAAVGLALILFAVCCFSDAVPFPGLAALVPCVGALLVIQSSPGTATAKILSWRPLVWIGLISYSLYLYHWPLIVYAKYVLMVRPDVYGEIALPLCCLAVGLAYLSYRYIESPFRRGAALGSRRSLFVATASAMGLVVCFGLGAEATAGFPQRLPPDIRAIALGATDTKLGRDRCDSLPAADVLAGKACPVGRSGTALRFAVFGDSFGEAVLPGIDAAAQQRGERGVALVHSGCYPLLGVTGVNSNPGERDACRSFVDASMRYIDMTPSIEKIVLVGRWTSAAEGSRFGAGVEKGWFIVDGLSAAPGYDENRAVFARAIERTVAALAGRDVYVVADIPEQSFNVPRVEALCRYLGLRCPRGVTRAVFDRRQQAVRNILAASAEKLRFHIIDLGEKLCSASECRAMSNGIPLYSDDNHLSRAGALSIRDAFDPVFPSPVLASGDRK
jgi:peptidoglycan/LPS O-acetylase OafA/YrhL